MFPSFRLSIETLECLSSDQQRDLLCVLQLELPSVKLQMCRLRILQLFGKLLAYWTELRGGYPDEVKQTVGESSHPGQHTSLEGRSALHDGFGGKLRQPSPYHMDI